MAKHDYDLIVIGGGAAGLTAATGAGQLGAKTLLIEKEELLGGDCLHYGCVPSKSLIKSAYCQHLILNATKYGLPKAISSPVDLNKVMKRVHQIIETIQEHDSPDYIKKHCQVNTLFGSPKFLDNHTISLNRKKITAQKFIIATGSSAHIPPISGLDQITYLTNREIFQLKKLPESLIILGGGPIGIEMAQAFARLGTRVKIIHSRDQLLKKEDADIGEFAQKKLESEGVKIYFHARAVSAQKKGKAVEIIAHNQKTNKDFAIEGEQLLIAVGRRPNLEGLDLQKAGINLTKEGITVDKRLRTSAKNIYACGDVNGGYLFTHVAGYEGGLAMINAITRLPVQADYTNVPWCTYMDPEIASIGLNEKRANEANLKYTVHKEEYKNNDRALAESETDGFIKILRNEKGKVIGVQLVGYHAGDIIHEWVAALNAKTKLSTIAQSIHAYPTLSEINKTASGNILAPALFNPRVKRVLKFLFGLQGS